MKAQEEGDEGGEEEEKGVGCLIDYSINIIRCSDLVYLKLRVSAVCMLKSMFKATPVARIKCLHCMFLQICNLEVSELRICFINTYHISLVTLLQKRTNGP